MFKKLYLEGKIDKVSAIYQHIDMWHDSDSKEELHEYLGLTIGEYVMFMENYSEFSRQMRALRGDS